MAVSRADEAQWVGAKSPDRAAAAGEARSARAFVSARRHSVLVRILRVTLIFGALGGVATLTALGLYRTFGSPFDRLSVGQVSIDGTKITMERPRLTGARQDGGGYVINAAKAIQDIAHPTQVELVDIDGDIGGANHDTLHLTATRGHYDTEKEALDLSGIVHLRNSSYTVDLKNAHVDFKSNAYDTREGVTVVTTSGTSIVADAASVRENAQVISFEGHVKTLIPPHDANTDKGNDIKGTQP
jgi:lipopolysaccharide export system protein LptC